MISEWQEFLIQSGANLRNDRVLDFGDPAAEQQATVEGHILCDLSHLGLIAASGEETVQFLNGQLTNDVTQVSDSHSQLSAYCNPKGRMLVVFRIFKRGETYFLRIPRTALELFLTRLRMFVLRAKVKLTDASSTVTRIGYCGPNAEATLQAITKRIPQTLNECVQISGVTIIRVAGTHPRYEIYGEMSAATQLWSSLTKKATPAGASQWSLLDILAGVPTVSSQNTEVFVPQMLNLDIIGGVSFKKGCYPGQEVVARTRYLGKLKRRMYRIHISNETTPQPGDDIIVSDGHNTQPIGRIVDAQPHPRGGNEALAVIQINEAQNNRLRLRGAGDSSEITVQKLPYAFDSPS